ncbi:MAG TPA: ATP-binding protein [Mucilaginibacter sp.]|nr:ATP-binding protein [Mucilaginibacter sp.]
MSQFTLATWIDVGLYLVAAWSLAGGVELILGGALLLAAIAFGEKEPDFQPFRPVLVAHYPLAGVSVLSGLVELIANKFYHNYGNYFVFAILAGFVWIMARWATTKKQREEFKFITQQNIMLDKLVGERTAELTKQKDELQHTLDLLQTTQQQLIQSEKLASLGELTAGIAHEIQNPLNFVNNFSEVSMELIDEMEAELAKGDTGEANAIAADIKQNLGKIIHHGKRADAIVKGMLQHSRASSNTKEPTDINKLADEYLRLAYHGLRAKDKTFNAELVTNFGEGLPLINMVPQDIGRVLLNLFNNAFYAVHAKQATAGAEYKPVVTLNTLQKNGSIIISIADNGTGIPEEVKDKVMQPFFTTKPTGEGTGLGLSLSYDIVVKGHSGNIEVKSEEGEGSEFIVTLPII